MISVFLKRWRKLSLCLTAAAFISLPVTTPQAATLDVVGGELQGATGVNVGGTLYDVEFLDGTCASVFGGCDSLADFQFNTLAGANAASQALFDQVLLGAFDTDSEKTRGITNTYVGALVTPYEFFTSFGQIKVNTSRAQNFSDPNNANDYVLSGGSAIVYLFEDLTDQTAAAWAKWTISGDTLPSAVPIPAALPLFGAGIAAMGFFGWRRKRRTVKT
ncbi:MAG: hypothetical protein V7750_18590 [Sneathiella sp.]